MNKQLAFLTFLFGTITLSLSSDIPNKAKKRVANESNSSISSWLSTASVELQEGKKLIDSQPLQAIKKLQLAVKSYEAEIKKYPSLSTNKNLIKLIKDLNQAYYLLGKLFFNQGNFNQASKYFQQAGILCKRTNQTLNQADFLLNQASANIANAERYVKNNPKHALEQLFQTVNLCKEITRLYKSLNNTTAETITTQCHLAKTYTLIGDAYFNQRDKVNASKNYQLALNIWQTYSEYANISEIEYLKQRLSLYSANNPQSPEKAKTSVPSKIISQLSAQALNNLQTGTNKIKTNPTAAIVVLAAAIKQYKQAIQSCSGDHPKLQQNLTNHLAKTYTELARAYNLQHNFTKATTYYLNAYDLYKTTNNLIEQANILTLIAYNYLTAAKKEPEKALTLLTKSEETYLHALDLYKQLKEDSNHTQILYPQLSFLYKLFGYTYFKENKLSKAAQYYTKYKDLAVAEGQLPDVQDADQLIQLCTMPRIILQPSIQGAEASEIILHSNAYNAWTKEQMSKYQTIEEWLTAQYKLQDCIIKRDKGGRYPFQSLFYPLNIYLLGQSLDGEQARYQITNGVSINLIFPCQYIQKGGTCTQYALAAAYALGENRVIQPKDLALVHELTKEYYDYDSETKVWNNECLYKPQTIKCLKSLGYKRTSNRVFPNILIAKNQTPLYYFEETNPSPYQTKFERLQTRKIKGLLKKTLPSEKEVFIFFNSGFNNAMHSMLIKATYINNQLDIYVLDSSTFINTLFNSEAKSEISAWKNQLLFKRFINDIEGLIVKTLLPIFDINQELMDKQWYKQGTN